jgi:hypothetical protein
MCQVRPCSEPGVPKVRSCGDRGILLQSCEICEPSGDDQKPAWKSEVEGVARRDRRLLKRAKKFQSEDLQVTQCLLAADLGGNWWSLAGYQARAGSGRCRDGQMHSLPGPQHMRRRNTCTARTDIQCSGQLHEFQARSIIPTEKNRDLDANPGGRTRTRRIHSGLIPYLVDTYGSFHSTGALVQKQHFGCQMQSADLSLNIFLSDSCRRFIELWHALVSTLVGTSAPATSRKVQMERFCH